MGAGSRSPGMTTRPLRLPLPAIVLLATAVASSYTFYNVNNLKLLVLGIGIGALLLIKCIEGLASRDAAWQAVPWKTWAVLALPLLATAPGYFLHREMTHFYLPVELATQLLLILWSVLLVGWFGGSLRGSPNGSPSGSSVGSPAGSLRDRREIAAFLVGTGATLACVAVIAIAEAAGWPGKRAGQPDDPRVLGTFGSPNVLAAFLIPLLPLFLVFAGRNLSRGRGPAPPVSVPGKEHPRPWKKLRDGRTKQPRDGRPKQPIDARAGEAREIRSSWSREAHAARSFGWAVAAAVLFILGAIALFLAQSRMGIFAWCAAGGIAVALSCRQGRPSRWIVRPTRQSVIILALLAVGAASGLAALRMRSDDAYGSYARRVAAVSTFRGWSSRMVPWDAAMKSIRDAPVFGYGPGTSYELFFKHVSPASRAYAEGRSFAHAHSEILEVLQEGGLLGALMTAALFGYVVWVTLKAMRRNRGDPFVRDLGVAVLAGIAGYGLCAALTESSRMIGSKLALYTLFGVALSLPKLDPSLEKTEDAMRGGMRRPLLECALSIALVVAALGVLVPVLRSMRLFAEMAAKPVSAPLMLKIDAATKVRPNPYCMFYLVDWQVKSGRHAEAHQTIERLNSLIPHYRETDYLDAYLAVAEKDLGRAKAVGLRAFERDRYYQPNLALLTTVAAATKDTSLFLSALTGISEWAAIRSGLSWKGREGIEVVEDPHVSGIEIRQDGDATRIVWSAALADGILRWRVATLGGWDYPAKDRFGAWLDREFRVRGVGDAADKQETIDALSEQLRAGVTRMVQ